MSESYQFGLIGSNIGYSRSPAVFDAIFDVDGVTGSFDLHDISPNEFDSRFNRLLHSDITGLSVTIPYKQRVIDKLDELDPAAEALNAVNSIAVGEKLRGFNTDVYGFALPLVPLVEELRNGRALIIGCGGGARAAAFTLAEDYAVSEIVLLGRSLDSLTCCRHELQAAIPECPLTTLLASDFESRRDESFAITVNGTPLGGWNYPDRSPLPPGFDWSCTAVYYDLNYNESNPIVDSAAASGVTAFDGSRMLVGQAVRSYGLWTGRKVEFDAVYARVFNC